jgi:hypothetical protein
MATPPAEWKLPELRIDVEGEWFDGDVQVTHPGILANLRSNLRKDAEGYFIQTRVRIPVRVDDVPWLVTRLERRGERLHAFLNDDVPYCAVKDGAFEARLSRAATFQLWALAEYDEASGRGALRLGGREYPLARAS